MIPRAAAARLSLYLRELRRLQRDGIERISSRQLATELGVKDAIVRKDLAYLGAFGRRGVGYIVEELSQSIRTRMCGPTNWRVILVGAGNLGAALLGYRGFADQGFEVIAALDVDPQRIGKRLGNVTIEPLEHLEKIVSKNDITLAILAVPAEAALPIAQRIAATGLTGILNFAPTTLRLGGKTIVANVDLASELQQLAFSVNRREA
jgi:redox-sensing transcriptional repressor